MIPILYEKTEQDFDSLGLGVLADTISCEVTEERNGLFELELKYPIDSPMFEKLQNERIIVADASKQLANQRFVIHRISKPKNKIVAVYAEHITQYKTKNNSIKSEVSFNGDASAALNTWNNNLLHNSGFEINSNVGNSQSGLWSIDKFRNARHVLGGVDGSILDRYGGEYLFNNNRISLLANRGADNGVTIAYGKNLIDVAQEDEITNTVTSIQPYCLIFTNEGTEDEILTLPEEAVHSEYVDNYVHPKIQTIDFSGEGIETVAQLRARTSQYILDNNIGIPKVNLKINFIDLTKTLEYKDVAKLEEINLCDTVTINYEKLGINGVKAKVIKTKYNPLVEQYTQIEIGEARSSFNQQIRNIENKIEQEKTANYSTIAQIRQSVLDTYINGDAYEYNLLAGNEYGLPSGRYSFDKPIEQNPTKVIFIGGGVMAIANSKNTDGSWDWRTVATGDGFIADTMFADYINANLIVLESTKTLDTEISDIQTQITTNRNDIDQHGMRITATESTVDGHGTTIATHGTRLTNVEAGKITLSSQTNGVLAGMTITSSTLRAASGDYGVQVSGNPSNTPIWVGNSGFTLPKFRVTWDGKMLSKDADVEGKITATSGTFTNVTISSGTIGGFNIANNILSAGSGSNYVRITGGAGSWPIVIGSETVSNAPFRVKYDGTFVASSATITGNITATSGSIGGFTLASNILSSGSGTEFVRITGRSGYVPLMIGGESTSNAAFYVTRVGKLVCTNADIKGTVKAGSVINGSLNSTTGTHVGTHNGTYTGTATTYSGSSIGGSLNSAIGSFNGSVYSNSGTLGSVAYASYSSSLQFQGSVRVELIQAIAPSATSTIAGNLNVYGKFSNPSDENLKEDIKDIDADEYLKSFYNLKLKNFKFKDRESEFNSLGIIAQDFIKDNSKKLIGEVVGINDGYFTVDYLHLFKMNILATQELNKRLTKLEEKLSA